MSGRRGDRDVGVVELCDRIVLGVRGAPQVLGDYLNERGWAGFRIERNALDKVTESLITGGHLDDRLLHTLACDYASYLLPWWEDRRPDDPRPRQAIATKRRWMTGEADAATLDVARTAAEAAAFEVGLLHTDPFAEEADDEGDAWLDRSTKGAYVAAWTSARAAMASLATETALVTVQAASHYASWWNLLRVTARRLEAEGL